MNSIALLKAWEESHRHSRIERPLFLLAAAEPGTSVDEWALLPIGERDGRLLRLREELFGSKLEAVAACPSCKERLEIGLTTQDIRVPSLPHGDLELSEGDLSVQFRLPNTADILAASEAANPRDLLLGRCILELARHGQPATHLPSEVADAVVKKMGDADPQATIDLAMECPACGHKWSIPFDICSYLWSEVEELVGRLFREVHSLARAYGWSETEILSMSPVRRRVYLEMVGA